MSAADAAGRTEATPAAGPRTGTIEEALDALRAGRPVLVLDDESRENEGDVVLAADTLTPQWLGWTIRHSSGYVCAPVTGERADALGLPLMWADNRDSFRTAYTVTCDAAEGVTTGISAADRTHTIRLLAEPATTADDLVRPGHVVPLRARPGGVLERPGHTEACVDLARLAGLAPVGAIAELVHDDGSMMRAPAVHELAREHGLVVVTIEALVAYRRVHDRVVRVARTSVPTRHGRFDAVGYRDLLTGAEHVALLAPGVAAGDGSGGAGDGSGAVAGAGGEARLVRLHSECLTGDAFGSLRCDCGPQLDDALARVADAGGAVVYLRGHEGRGVGLLDKLRAYGEQDAGADTVDAQTALGLPVDAREYGAGAAILRDLGLDRVRLLTNNPAKVDAVRAAGIDVEPVATPVAANPANLAYLRTKRDRMHHTFDPAIPLTKEA